MATKAYALRVKPEISAADAKKAENQLNTRFKKVADKYGDEMQKQNQKTADGFTHKMQGAFTALKSKWALVAGAVAGVVGAILSNPIDEADAKLNEFLSKIDNIATRAQQWGVAPEKFLIASEIASTAGAGDGLFDQALLRVAERLEMARTGEDPTLEQFTGAKDVIDAFFQLAQTWNNMNPQARAASMADILGARQANQFAELVQTDWLKRAQEILESGGIDYDQLAKAIAHGADLEEKQAISRSGLRLREYARIAAGTSDATISAQRALELARQDIALTNVDKYIELAETETAKIQTVDKNVNDIRNAVIEGVGYLAELAGVKGDEKQAQAIEQIKNSVKSDLDVLTAPVPKKSGASSAIGTLWGA